MNNQKGISLILIISTMGLLSLLALSALLMQSLDLRKDWKASLTFTNKNHLVYTLAEDLSQEIALRFSRYSTNAKLQQCLTGLPTPCDESVDYDMVLYAPIGQQSFQGGTWPDPPPGALLLAGGKTDNTVLYRYSGARCTNINQTIADDFCPLQALIKFRPLCGGTNSIPEIQAGGPKICAGAATGFDITIGVGRFMNGTFVYHKNVDAGGDSRIYRFSSNVFRN